MPSPNSSPNPSPDPSLDPSPGRNRTIDHVAASLQPETVDVSQPGESTGPHSPMPPAEAPTIPGYRITAEIAKGGMGRVYAGHDLTLDREVAIKTLLPGADAERFVSEAKITARLPHPAIPPVHALGTLDDGTPWLAMKLIHGQTLTTLLKSRQPSPPFPLPEGEGRQGEGFSDLPRYIQVFESIAQAVGFAHARGIIHRDLKPLNVMVGEFGEAEPLLIKGDEGMKAREKTPAADAERLALQQRLAEALDRLIELYTAGEKPDQVKKYPELRSQYPLKTEDKE